VYAGAGYPFVPDLVSGLFPRAKKTGLHPPVKSSAIHLEIEFTHPFTDGNGSIGRLWQTLILSRWNELFVWLPVGTAVYENRQEYYRALAESQKTADAGVVIEFMPPAVLRAPEGIPSRRLTDIFTGINTDKLAKNRLEFLERIAGYLDKNGEITNFLARLLTGKSDIGKKKCFARFVELGILRVEGKNRRRRCLIAKKRDTQQFPDPVQCFATSVPRRLGG
jgi:Fic family protein